MWIQNHANLICVISRLVQMWRVPRKAGKRGMELRSWSYGQLPELLTAISEVPLMFLKPGDGSPGVQIVNLCIVLFVQEIWKMFNKKKSLFPPPFPPDCHPQLFNHFLLFSSLFPHELLCCLACPCWFQVVGWESVMGDEAWRSPLPPLCCVSACFAHFSS